jgi:hypothetical protein
LALGHSIFEPMILHVKGFGYFHADLGLEDTRGSGVIGFERSDGGKLFVAHLFEGSDHGGRCLSIEKETASFGFRVRGSNGTECFVENMDGTVEFGCGRSANCTWEISEEIITGSTTACVGKDKVHGVGANGEDRATGVVSNGGIWVGGKKSRSLSQAFLVCSMGEA